MYKNTLTPQRAAPAASSGIIGWLRANLFSGLFSSIFTLLGIYVLYLLLVPMISWAFVNADWLGNSREACVSGGACWVFISNRLQQFTYGFYPSNEIWRINLTFVLFVLQLLWLALPRLPACQNVGRTLYGAGVPHYCLWLIIWRLVWLNSSTHS